MTGSRCWIRTAGCAVSPETHGQRTGTRHGKVGQRKDAHRERPPAAEPDGRPWWRGLQNLFTGSDWQRSDYEVI